MSQTERERTNEEITAEIFKDEDLFAYKDLSLKVCKALDQKSAEIWRLQTYYDDMAKEWGVKERQFQSGLEINDILVKSLRSENEKLEAQLQTACEALERISEKSLGHGLLELGYAAGEMKDKARSTLATIKTALNQKEK